MAAASSPSAPPNCSSRSEASAGLVSPTLTVYCSRLLCMNIIVLLVGWNLKTGRLAVPNVGRARPPFDGLPPIEQRAHGVAQRMAPQLAQKRHFAADALPPDAVDKPLHVRWPDSRRPVQDEACGDEFACAVLALIAIGSPAAVAEEAMPGIEVRCALSAALSDSEQNQRSRARRRLCSLRSRD